MAGLFAALLSLALSCGTAAAIDYKIVTADQKGTYYAIGQDLEGRADAAADARA